MKPAKFAPKKILALLPLALLFACTDSNTPDSPPYDRAVAKNEVQLQKWKDKHVARYQYTLYTQDDSDSQGYSALCTVAPDTSYCSLTVPDSTRSAPTAGMEDLFDQAGYGIPDRPPLGVSIGSSQTTTKTVLFLGADSLDFHYAITHVDEVPPGVLLVGAQISYDSLYGYPRAIVFLPERAVLRVSQFTILAAP